jgi:hypothetical protein
MDIPAVSPSIFLGWLKGVVTSCAGKIAEFRWELFYLNNILTNRTIANNN